MRVILPASFLHIVKSVTLWILLNLNTGNYECTYDPSVLDLKVLNQQKSSI